MKRAYKNANGGVSVVTFASGKDPDTAWAEMRKRDPSIPEQFIDVEDKDLPARVDENGIPIRNTWRIKGGKIKEDKTVRNIHKEIDEEKKKISSLIVKKSPTPKDVMDLKKMEAKLEKLVVEIKNSV